LLGETACGGKKKTKTHLRELLDSGPRTDLIRTRSLTCGLDFAVASAGACGKIGTPTRAKCWNDANATDHLRFCGNSWYGVTVIRALRR